MRKKRNIITIVVVIFILLTAFISLTGEQNIVFAGEDDTSIFLKTIIPSRQMNKKYNKGVSK